MAVASTELGRDGALFTDLYELTMAAAYFTRAMVGPATFSLSVRRYPPGRGYFVAAGVEDVLDYLAAFQFSEDALEYLQQKERLAPAFIDFLRTLRFTGDVWALPEGTVCFVDEPLLEITAPLIEAQIIETFVINQLNLQTLLTTKVARCVDAAAGKPVIDFSLRRTQGTAAGMQVARCAMLGGAVGTSNVLAGLRWGLPTYGTMAHAFIESFDDETEAFRAYASTFPDTTTLLVDTYDTLEGVRHAIAVARELKRAGKALRAVRLDSGDLDALSRGARALLDAAGFNDVHIIASGGLDEYLLETLVQSGAPIDAFGVGTSMGVSSDAPALDCAYKLVEYGGRPRLKLSSEKVSLAGRKQVWRRSAEGRMTGDTISLRDEAPGGVEGEPLLQLMMRDGRVQRPRPSLDESCARVQAQLKQLPESCRDLRQPARFPVAISPALSACQREVKERVRLRETRR